MCVYPSSFTAVTHSLVKLPIFLLLKVDSFVINIKKSIYKSSRISYYVYNSLRSSCRIMQFCF